MLMADLRSPRSELTLVEGAPLERLREFLIAADSGDDAPGALRDADRLWRSATLRCGMRRRPMSEAGQIALGGLTDDMVHCWWLDQRFEVRDVGAGRIVSFPMPDDSDEFCEDYLKQQAESVFRSVPSLRARAWSPPRCRLIFPHGIMDLLGDRAGMLAGARGGIGYVHSYWWRRGAIVRAQQLTHIAPPEWFPPALEAIWVDVATSNGTHEPKMR